MRRRFTNCNRTVVTRHTGALHLSVIDTCYRLPYAGDVAVLAQIRGKNVRRIFSGGGRAVMA